MPRILSDWLNSYMQFTSETEPPELFRLWSGISALAAVLQRKCFTQWELTIHPNFYIGLVGTAGSRKGTAMAPAEWLLEEVGIPLASQSITREAFIAQVEECQTKTIDPDTEEDIIHSSLTVFSDELAVFLGRENTSFLPELNNLYDNRRKWEYRTKTAGTNSLVNACVNLIGATTPELIKTSLPNDVVGGGFTSRCIFVFGDKSTGKIIPVAIPDEATIALGQELLTDLGEIHKISGKFSIEQSYLDLYTTWYTEHRENEFSPIPALQRYAERRQTHLRKLSMVLSASQSSNRILDADCFNRSLKILTKTEKWMPHVFSSYGRLEKADIFESMLVLIKQQKTISYGILFEHFYRDVTREEFNNMLRTLAKGFDPPWIAVDPLSNGQRQAEQLIHYAR